MQQGATKIKFIDPAINFYILVITIINRNVLDSNILILSTKNRVECQGHTNLKIDLSVFLR